MLPEGQEALKEIVPDREFLDGFVVSENQHGVWLSLPEFRPVTEAILLKWEHFSTAVVDYQPELPATREQIGFRA